MKVKLMRHNLILILFLLNNFVACGQKQFDNDKLFANGMMLFNSNQFNKAFSVFDTLVKINSDDFVSWTCRARTLHLLNRDEEAMQSLNKAITINPNYYDAFSYRAAIFSINGQHQLALNDIQFALTDKQSDTSLLLLRAGYYYKCRKYDSSIIDYSNLLNLKLDKAKIYYYRAKAFKLKGDFTNAINDYNKSSKLEPNNSYLHNDRGFLYLTQGKYELAIEDFSKTIEFSNKFDSTTISSAYNNRAYCLYKQKQLDKALDEVNKAIKVLSTNSYAYKTRALIYIQLLNKVEACKDIEMSLSLGFTKSYGNEVQLLKEKNCR